MKEGNLSMNTRKGSATKEDLQGFKKEILQQFHVVSEGVIDQVKQVAEGVDNVNEKLDRRFNELKAEIQETRQEVLAAVKFSYAELDKRLTTLEKEFIELKHRVEKIESRPIS
jgi:predicted  nucleic acid-binding Zn-ribbon protein